MSRLPVVSSLDLRAEPARMYVCMYDFIVVPPPFLGPSWAQLGLSWALLGPSWGVQEGILRQILGLEGLLRGC